MKSVTFDAMKPGETYVFYSTPNVKIYRQLGFISDETKRYLSVPCTDVGYLIVSRISNTLENLGIVRYVLHRPASIEVQIPWDCTVQFDTLEYAVVKKHALGTPKDWAHITPSRKW